MGVSARRALFAVVVFWSALLLLLVQPVMAKAILPWFGGSAGVWTTSMLFFQLLLLLGYTYAHLLHRRFTPRQQVAVHGSLLILSLLVLPLQLAPAWKPTGNEDPAARILGLLVSGVGLPYFLLASTSPLLQAWYARTFQTEFPYRLFAVSNLGSLVALLSYPVLVEPWLTVGNQLIGWSAGFVLFAALCTGAGVLSLRQAEPLPAGSLPDRTQILCWLALAAVPSVLWLAIGNHFSQDVAAVPFLWILPLAVYLLSFVLCFDTAGWYRQRLFRWILPPAWVTIALVVSQRGYVDFVGSVVALALALFVCCMFCHGELARLRPDAGSLTTYYLCIAGGGALGGLFVGLIGPRLFSDYLELPIGVLACVLLSLPLLYNLGSKRVMRIGAVAGVATVAAVVTGAGDSSREVNIRNFYGTLKVTERGSEAARYRALFNGTIQHGVQFLAPDRSRIATTYYGQTSGAAIALEALQRHGPVHIGVIGLGVGTMAAYARPDDRVRFYEINPAVVKVANTEFRYLQESQAPVDVVPGDARLALEREPPQSFDMLVVDAFSGDSIPVHLLTREAFDVYFRHLAPNGAIAVHVTNKHLDLAPVVKMIAGSHDARSILLHSSSEDQRKLYSASWVIVTKNPTLVRDLLWQSSPFDPNPRLRMWTDDYSNLLMILK